MLQILVTGAAGYIGSAITCSLVNYGHKVLGLDNLDQGHLAALSPEVEFIKADIADVPVLKQIFTSNDIDAVIHLAALSQVGASTAEPGPYYTNNLLKSLILLETMREFGIKRMIFSSSASVYGSPQSIPIVEEEPVKPMNPYGSTKGTFEEILSWYEGAYGSKAVSLRYFNAAGSTHISGEDHSPETHLIPNIFKVVLGQADSLRVFGDNHATPDGTAIRDYVHIQDIANVHLKLLENFDRVPSPIYNVGLGCGYSINEIVTEARRITSHPIPIQIYGKRPGDPPALIAETSKLRNEIGWEPTYDTIESILESSWRWHRTNPEGYTA